MVFLIAVVLISLAVWVSSSLSKMTDKPSKMKDPPYTFGGNSANRGSYRGAKGSSGMSVKDVGKHSVNCECNICLYGHDPDKRSSCQCKSCRGLVAY